MHLIFSTFFIRPWAILWLCCVPLLTQAQTGPGGVGNSSSNKVWLDASALSGLSNGVPVSTWTDRSGNGWNANQASAANRPSFLSNALNGKPVIHFDHSSAVQYLELTTAGIGGAMSNSNTIFAVAKANSGALDNNTDNSGNHQSIFMAVGYHGGLFFYGYPTTALAFTTWANDRNTGFYHAMAATQGQWQMGMLRNTETAAVSSFVSALNGTSAASQSGNFQMFNYADLVRIGVASNPGMPYSWPLNGDIAEIILYNTDLNDAQRIIVENYLSAKYNLPIVNDYYTSHAPAYSQDVQGIGTTDGTSAHKHAQAVNGKGLLLAERNSSLNGENEFLLAGHAPPANSMVSSDLPSGTQQRWQRDWYLEKRGALEAKLSFDISEAGLSGSIQSANTYRLLYRSSNSGNFREVSSNGTALLPSIENGDQLAFILPDALLSSGYYTLGVAASTLVWTGVQDQDWNQGANWNLGRVPTAQDQVVVNACSICPKLRSAVNVAGLQLNSDSRLNLEGYSLLVSGGVSLTQAQVQSSKGTLRAVDFNEVKNCRFLGAITLEKTGGSLNSWYGGNQFSQKVKLVNTSSSSWQVSNTTDNLIQSP